LHSSFTGALWVLLLWGASSAISDDQAAPAPAAETRAETPVTKSEPSEPKTKSKTETTDAAKPAAPGEAVSAAEQVVNLRRSITAGETRLAELKAERDDPNGEYAQAEAAFAEADSALEAAKNALKATSADDEPARKAAQDEVARREKTWNLSKDRFDLAIEDRKANGEQFVNLEKKLQLDRQALDKLEGKEPPAPEPAPVPEAAPVSPAETRPAETPAPAAPAAAPADPAAPSVPVPAAPAPVPAAVVNQPPSKEVVAAVEDAQAKSAAAKAAEDEAQTATERLTNLDKEIALERKMLANHRKQSANAVEVRRELTESFRARSLAGAPRVELDELLAELKQIEVRHKEADDEIREHSARLERLQAEQADLQAEQIDALRKAEAARAQVKLAEDDVRRLENPFSPRNVLQWTINHGPRMLTVLIAILIGHWSSRIFSQRVIRLLSRHGARGSSAEREDRARTLVGVFHNTASLAIIVGGGLMILQEAGVPIAPLLGGAAVFGLAVAFGAQNLIRDYFYGFVILLENQYKLNDVVRIGDRSGQVEKITLRMTVLRDQEGNVHFLPNGEITAVTNMTHGWSRALFSINVAYKEKIDDVIAVLMSLAADLRKDPVYAPMILDDAAMLGVDDLSESWVVIKFHVKTRPLQQWNVKRELLRRIKNRFDELNIELPFPQRTVTIRDDTASILPAAPSRILQGLHTPRSSG
jgi:small conductance mechanosensitive channel